MNFEKNINKNEDVDVLESESNSLKDNSEEKGLLDQLEKEAEEKTTNELKEVDQQKASEEVEKARKSIFGKIGEMFKGKEKTEEEKREQDIKDLEKTLKSLTHTSSTTLELGASFGMGIDRGGAKSEELKNKLDEISDLNKKLSKLDRGQEKVDLIYKKRKLIGEFAKIGREEIKNKYNIAS